MLLANLSFANKLFSELYLEARCILLQREGAVPLAPRLTAGILAVGVIPARQNFALPAPTPLHLLLTPAGEMYRFVLAAHYQLVVGYPAVARRKLHEPLLE
jgi:hypothetical protein